MSRGPRELLRVGTRSSAFVGVTLALWASMDIETLIRAREERDLVQHKWVHFWARTLLTVFAVQMQASGLHVAHGNLYPGRAPNGVGRVFVMNHRSGLDIVIAFAHAEAYLLSRHDLARWPMIGRGARRLGTLFVDRSSMRSGATVLKAMTRTLQEGHAIFVFPEGTAFDGDEVRPFKPGAFNAAHRTGAEIVPMGIAYADQRASYGDESFLQHLERVAGMREVLAALEVGEPITPNGRSVPDLRDLSHQRVVELVGRARGRLKSCS